MHEADDAYSDLGFFVYSCRSTLECYDLFSGVGLSIRSFSFSQCNIAKSD